MDTLNKLFIGIYIDLENIRKDILLKDMMNDIKLRYSEENQEPVFAVKIACGISRSISKYRDQLKELNFDIRETPHVAQKKNRADLIISLDAFEKLYINQPNLSLFVFLTNDSDYSVIMDLLRKYGKDVWLVTNEEDSKRDIFKNCCDNILTMNEYTPVELVIRNLFAELVRDIDLRTVVAMLKVLKSLNTDRKYDVVYLNNQFRKVENSVNLKHTRFKNFHNLYRYMEEKNILKYTIIKGEKNMVSEINFDLIHHRQ